MKDLLQRAIKDIQQEGIWCTGGYEGDYYILFHAVDEQKVKSIIQDKYPNIKRIRSIRNFGPSSNLILLYVSKRY